MSKHAITHYGHDIEVDFNTKLVVLNRVALAVDGEVVDSARIFYGDRELSTTLPDGTAIVVKVDSGMYGELVRAQLRAADGSWVDLVERETVV